MNCRSLIIVLFILSGITTCITIHYAWCKGKHSLLLYRFILLQVLLLLWACGDFLRLFLTDYHQKWVIVRLEYGVICFVGFSWLIFCLQYVKSRLLNKYHYRALLIWPTFCYLVILTNDFHHLFLRATDHNFNQFGPFFYWHALGGYIYCAIGAAVLLVYVFRQRRYLKWQVILLFLSGFIPLLINFLAITKVICVHDFDFTPLSFNVTSILLLIGILRYKFLDILPIALRKIVDQMKEIVLVVDSDNRIIDYNQAATATFPELSQFKPGEMLHEVLKFIREKYKLSDQPNNRELFIEQTGKWFGIGVQPLSSQGVVLGRIISLNDITEYKCLSEELHHKNVELISANRQLQRQAAVAEELATVKERGRVVQNIHDTLGQTMTLLITTLQLCMIQYQTNPAEIAPKLDQALEFANKAAQQTRKALYELASSDEDEADRLSIMLTGLIAEFQNCGLDIQLLIESGEYPVNRDAIRNIRGLCQEAMTNTLRHSNARHLTIKLRYLEDSLKIEIIDDGLGCPDIRAGIGLRGMEQRVNLLNGRINFISRPDSGFIVAVELPKLQLLPSQNLSGNPDDLN